VLTLALYGLLAVVVMGGLFLIAVNVLPSGEQIAPPIRDEAPWDLPASRPLGPEDVAAIRLPVALRGYRFAETDVLLDRLGEELRARDVEIAQLRSAAVGARLAADGPWFAGEGEERFAPPPVLSGPRDVESGPVRPAGAHAAPDEPVEPAEPAGERPESGPHGD
jgi:hypothetical protein